MMSYSKVLAFILVALIAASLKNAVEMVQGRLDTSMPNLAVSISASFPSSSDDLGVRILNGHKTCALLEFINSEAEPIIVSSVKGALFGLDAPQADAKPSASLIHNLTSANYNIEIQAGEKRAILFTFTTNFQPQDFRLNIAANISHREGSHQVQAFDEIVKVLDSATSIFDPQILFLYILLAASAGIFVFWAYKSWIQPLLPQTKRGTKSGEQIKRSNNFTETPGSSENQARAVSSATGQKLYDESWIPEHHIKKTTAKRSKGGSTKKSAEY
ncbi:Increased recombination centers protein 22-2 [Golovinomyces cichoracearum]|uniref:Increased recombination centers protein 22-2 n=1 Tax=Golovinomyces cichoracearum TaxID=62708 RepID=A0A420ISP5_9PEZI|nr:Increased recombination centers protein 22-2 [Golovinomyces cichoracearum]